LNREPKDYKISEILTAMDEELAPVACLTCGGEGCSRSDNCRTLPMWKNFHEIINNFFDNLTLADLMQKN
ncbi:MAG: Rrf2 family transcriptional regulator, partial [Synergistaceae bacterium]|nr:Rrf2 family transcriptional regulator [Synergistaceae bacterium]